MMFGFYSFSFSPYYMAFSFSLAINLYSCTALQKDDSTVNLEVLSFKCISSTILVNA